MKVVELAHFTVDVAAMEQFYRTLLGMDAIAKSDDMAIFMIGETKIFIHKKYPLAEGELPPENHTAFAVADVDAACDSLSKQGLTIEVPPRDYYWGRSAYLRDPDRNLIEITAL